MRVEEWKRAGVKGAHGRNKNPMSIPTEKGESKRNYKEKCTFTQQFISTQGWAQVNGNWPRILCVISHFPKRNSYTLSKWISYTLRDIRGLDLTDLIQSNEFKSR